MDIKGYVPVNKEVATETGVEFSYKVAVGDEEYTFTFEAKYSGVENKGFQKAAEKVSHKRNIRKVTNYKQPTGEAMAEMLELWHDHIIIAWRCDVQNFKGKVYETTKENFVELLSEPIFVGVYLALQDDCGDYTKFNKTAEAKAGKK